MYRAFLLFMISSQNLSRSNYPFPFRGAITQVASKLVEVFFVQVFQ
jgi:hypothetical protein